MIVQATIFGSILKGIENFGVYVLSGIIDAVNVIIAGIAGFAQLVLLLLPSMPSPPTTPVADWVGWLNWLMPIADLVAALVVWVGIWLVYLLVRIPLRWVKAL